MRLAPNLNVLNPLKRLQQGVLHKVLRIRNIAGPLRQPAGRPAPQAGKITRHQPIERRCVSGTRARDQLDGRFDARFAMLVCHPTVERPESYHLKNRTSWCAIGADPSFYRQHPSTGRQRCGPGETS